MQDWIGFINAGATVVLAVLTAAYVWLTHRLVRAQSDPHVVIYARSDEWRPSVIELVIQNVGRSVATSITFEFSRPMFWRAYGTDSKSAGDAQPMAGGPLVTGIPALGPSEVRRITWGQFGGLKKQLGSDSITATVHFRDSRGRKLGPVLSHLDVMSFEHTDISGRDPALRLAKAAEKIQDDISSMAQLLALNLARATTDEVAQANKPLQPTSGASSDSLE
jgi:hypothetical protein